MHASNDARLVRYLDGLALSFVMLEHVQAQLQTVCSNLTKDKKLLPVAFWLCWSFVDAVHRIRELAQAIPGLSSKRSELRVFLDSTAIAEDFRNYIQHLRSELSKSPGNTFPVWGSLAWVDSLDPQLSHIALAGSHVGETQYPGCVFDTVEQKWVSKVSLSVNGLSFNFDPISAACMRFRDFVIPWLISSYALGIHLLEELPVLSVRFQPQVTGNT